MGSDKRQRQKEGRQQRLAEAAAAQRKAQLRRRITTLLIAAVVIGGGLFLVSLVTKDDDSEVASTDTTLADGSSTTLGPESTVPLYGAGECPPAEGVAEPVLEFADRPKECIDPAKKYTAVFDTNQGQVKVDLDTNATPGTVNNFVTLARYGYYDGTQIFRTDPSIAIIQGGAPHTNDPSDPGPGYTIKDEGTGFTYEPGQLVMARTAQPDSASAQFFFVAGPEASALDAQGTYVVFGNISEGLDVVEKILASHVADPSSSLGGGPDPEVIVNKVTIEEV